MWWYALCGGICLVVGFAVGNHFGYYHGRFDELQKRLAELANQEP